MEAGSQKLDNINNQGDQYLNSEVMKIKSVMCQTIQDSLRKLNTSKEDMKFHNNFIINFVSSWDLVSKGCTGYVQEYF
jgi:hypothetical protein